MRESPPSPFSFGLIDLLPPCRPQRPHPSRRWLHHRPRYRPSPCADDQPSDFPLEATVIELTLACLIFFAARHSRAQHHASSVSALIRTLAGNPSQRSLVDFLAELFALLLKATHRTRLSDISHFSRPYILGLSALHRRSPLPHTPPRVPPTMPPLPLPNPPLFTFRAPSSSPGRLNDNAVASAHLDRRFAAEVDDSRCGRGGGVGSVGGGGTR